MSSRSGGISQGALRLVAHLHPGAKDHAQSSSVRQEAVVSKRGASAAVAVGLDGIDGDHTRGFVAEGFREWAGMDADGIPA